MYLSEYYFNWIEPYSSHLFWVKLRTLLWRRQWHPTPVLLPGKSHGRRTLVGCSPWGRQESDMTKWLHFHFSLSCIGEGNGNPLQCSCLENPRDGGAWWEAVYGVAQSRTRLRRLSSSSSNSRNPPQGPLVKCIFISGTVDLQRCVHRFHAWGVGMPGPYPEDLVQGRDGGDPQEPAVCGWGSLPSEVVIYFGVSLHVPSVSLGSPCLSYWDQSLDSHM